MLHHHDSVSIDDQLSDNAYQILLLDLMQPDRGLVKHKDDGVHLRDDVACQEQSLDLTARERRDRTRECQVMEPHIDHAGQLCDDLLQQRVPPAARPVTFPQKIEQIADVHVLQLIDGPACKGCVGSPFAKSRPAAFCTGPLRHHARIL